MVPTKEHDARASHTGFVGLALLAFALCATSLPAHAAKQPTDSGSIFSFNLFSLFGTGGTGSPELSEKRTRVIIALARKTTFQVFSLNKPNRVIIDLPKVKMRLPNITRGSNTGLVKALRAGRSAPGRARIIVDVSEPVVVEKARIARSSSGAAQLVIDVVPFRVSAAVRRELNKRTGASSLGFSQPPMPRPATGRAATADTYKPLIVLDPGHGGRDSGAKKFGILEKHVVLQFSRELRDKLIATGRYRVKMTRDKDVFITLGNRRAFAERHKAALFVAVHADYASSNARGATIYSLRKRVADRLRASAAQSAARNALSKREMKFVSAKANDIHAVRGILGDLAQREVHVNLERTNVFTKFAIDQMGAATTMRSKPHRQAAFKVLKTARVPSVLIELAYVSNRRDAARLKSSRWRKEVSSSLVKAMDRYFAHSLSQLPQ